MQASSATTVSSRATLSGVCAVHRRLTSVGPFEGGIHQPLNPPSTSCGGSEISPASVDADQDSWKPSPSTSQQPSGQLSTVTVRLETVLRLDGDGGRCRRRRLRRRRSRGRRGRRRCRCAAPGVGGETMGAVGEAERCGPARRGLDRLTGEEVGDRTLDLHRDRLAIDVHEVVAATGVDAIRDDGALAERELGDRGGQDHRLGVAPVEHEARLDRRDLEANGAADRSGEPDAADPFRVGRRHDDLHRLVTGADTQRGDRGVVARRLDEVERPDTIRHGQLQGGADRTAEGGDPRGGAIVVGGRPAARGRDPRQPGGRPGPGDPEQVGEHVVAGPLVEPDGDRWGQGPRAGNLELAHHRRLGVRAPSIGRARPEAGEHERHRQLPGVGDRGEPHHLDGRVQPDVQLREAHRRQRRTDRGIRNDHRLDGDRHPVAGTSSGRDRRADRQGRGTARRASPAAARRRRRSR